MTEETKVSKLNGVQAWVVTIVLTLGGIIAAASVMKINPCASLIMQDFGIGEAMEGYLLSVCSIVGVIIAIPAGKLLEKFGPYKIGIFTLVITILGGAVGAMTTSYAVLLVARVFEGFAFAVWAIIGPLFINAWFTPNRRGFPMAIFSVWVGWCMLFIFRVANLVINRADPSSWHNVWWLTVIGAIIVLVLFILFARMPKGQPAATAEKGKGEASNAPAKTNAFAKFGLKSVPMWCIIIMFLIFSWAQQVITGYTSTYCQSILGMDVIVANEMTSQWTLGNVVGALLIGLVMYKVVKPQQRGLMFVAVSVISLIVYFVIFNYSADMASWLLLLAGFLCIMYTPIGFNSLPDVVAPSKLPMAMALASCTSMIGHVFVAFGGIAIQSAGYAGATVLLVCLGIAYVATAVVFYVSVKKTLKNAKAEKVQEEYEDQ